MWEISTEHELQITQNQNIWNHNSKKLKKKEMIKEKKMDYGGPSPGCGGGLLFRKAPRLRPNVFLIPCKQKENKASDITQLTGAHSNTQLLHDKQKFSTYKPLNVNHHLLLNQLDFH